MILKLVLFDYTLVYVQSYTASLDKTPEIIKNKMTNLITSKQLEDGTTLYDNIKDKHTEKLK